MFDENIKTNPNLVTALGIYIRSKRISKNIGLREMADLLQISPAYLSNIENGKHNMTNPILLKKIGKILNIDHLTLFKIIGYTDKDKKELEQEIWLELYSQLSDEDLKEIIQLLLKLDKVQLELVKQYLNLIIKK